MKFIVLHESSKRIRIRTPLVNMSMKQADTLEYYISSFKEIRKVSVDERTANAVIFFNDTVEGKRDFLVGILSDYDEDDEKTRALVPEKTGRMLNRKYQEKLILQIAKHGLCRLFLPAPIKAARTAIKSLAFLCKAAKTVAEGKVAVELLDGIAIGASILRGDFKTAASVMFLLETGEILEEWTRKKSVGDLARAMTLGIESAWVKTGNSEVKTDVQNVRSGDLVIVRTSGIIPFDGKVVSGEMTVNQMAMTGESVPVLKSPGGYVYAGTVVDEGECIIEVTKEAGSGKYDQIVKMIEESEKLKSCTEARAYRLADSLVPYSFAGFALTYLLTRNVSKALAFLMVDYSCAMKLSMPLAVLSAIKEAREYGISIKGGKFMEAVSEVDTIVFDKTGTLTYATAVLADIVTFGGKSPDEILRIAACLEEHYPHCVANAIVKEAKNRGLKHDELHSKVEYIVAHGVSSYIDDKKAVIGSYHFVMEDEKCIISEDANDRLSQIKPEYSRIYLAIDGILIGVLCISDPVRNEAADVIRNLRELGISRICMMTGDNETAARAVADRLGIDEFCAEVLPEDKAEFIKKLHDEAHKVIMIGDGVNDSPALAEADVGVAIEAGAAIAREVADITISADDLNSLIILRRISTALMKRISNNYKFIIGFNSSLIGLGLTGIITPATSALLHNGSTIFTGIRSTTDLIGENTKGSL